VAYLITRPRENVDWVPAAFAPGAIASLHPCSCVVWGLIRAKLLAVAHISDDFEQRLHALAPDRRDDAELGHVSPDGIDHRGLLADEELAGAMQRQELCCSGVLVSTNRNLALVTASQMASASAASFFCRLT
jgi:hypothetical protein